MHAQNVTISRRKKVVIVLITLAILGATGGSFILSRLLHLDAYREEIIAAVQSALGREVRYEKGDFSLRYGPSFTFTRVVVKERDGTTNLLAADRLTFKVSVAPLLQKRLVLKEMVLESPRIFLSRDRSGVLNIGDLLEERKEAPPLQVKGIRVRKGEIRFNDRAIAAEGVITSLEEVDLAVARKGGGDSWNVRLSTFVPDGGKKGTVSLAGTVELPARGKPLTDAALHMNILVKNLDVERYWPYYSRYVPFRKVIGHLDADTDFKGRLSAFTASGSMRMSGLRFHYPQVFHALLAPRELRIGYTMELNAGEVAVKALELTLDGLTVKGSCSIKDIHTEDPRITAKAVTSPFRLEEFGQYIPYGIIVKDTADFIEKHVRGGTYKLDEGRLDGRVSQILHMEEGENYNVLYIRGTVDKGLLSFGPGVPLFHDVKGELEMRGKDFNLRRMAGSFGTSPFTLEGKIADYPLDKPSAYPFTMNMTPGQAEVAWLLGQEKTGKLALSGASTLRLAGDGFTSAYNLSGEWNLTPAAYSYPDLVNKPAGRVNHLSFKGSINKREARLSSLQYTLPPMTLTATADYRFAGKRRLGFTISSNPFQLGETAPMLPPLAKYQPKGTIRAEIRGESSQNDLKDISWGGSVSLSAASFKPPGDIKPVSNLTGTVRFSGTTLETSQLEARLGSSTIYARGSLSGFRNPTLNLVFSSPSLDLNDLGLRPPNGELSVKKVQGNLSLKEGDIQIKSLAGQVNNSLLTLKGTVHDIRNPEIDLAVTSPRLDLDDIILLTTLRRGTKGAGPAPKVMLKASVHADTGRVKNMEFTRLRAGVQLEDRILYLQPLELSLFGGKFSGRGRVDFGSNGSPRYQVGYSLERVSAEQLLRAMEVKHGLVTGTMSAQGELTAKGEKAAVLKSTALGNAKLTFEDGTLKKFSVLSKIFSILNVSQLLKFQLPDMVSGGMPYNEITASLAIRDGIVSTSDLFIESDAMNISAVGKVDLVKEELDLTVGVQPLQTVDKVVSRIPIVGWILTGRERGLITAYFEAKGKWDDPAVTAIPVKSMAKGVFDIFKRVFQLPGKLITDTGEVILGK